MDRCEHRTLLGTSGETQDPRTKGPHGRHRDTLLLHVSPRLRLGPSRWVLRQTTEETVKGKGRGGGPRKHRGPHGDCLGVDPEEGTVTVHQVLTGKEEAISVKGIEEARLYWMSFYTHSLQERDLRRKVSSVPLI